MEILQPSKRILEVNAKPSSFSNLINSKRQFFDELRKKLSISKPEDWYNVSCDDILRNGGWSVLSKYRGSKGSNLLTFRFSN